MNLKLLVLLAAALFLSSCDYKPFEPEHFEENTNAATAQSKQADEKANEINPLILTGTSESRTFPCNGREIEITEDATSNNYTLTGECKKLTVDGVSNSVNVETVGEIVVTGVSNKIIYGEGLNGKKPKIKKSGTSTSVDSQKSLEEKSKSENK